MESLNQYFFDLEYIRHSSGKFYSMALVGGWGSGRKQLSEVNKHQV